MTYEIDALELGERVANELEMQNLKPLPLLRPDLPAWLTAMFDWFKAWALMVESVGA